MRENRTDNTSRLQTWLDKYALEIRATWDLPKGKPWSFTRPLQRRRHGKPIDVNLALVPPQENFLSCSLEAKVHIPMNDVNGCAHPRCTLHLTYGIDEA